MVKLDMVELLLVSKGRWVQVMVPRMLLSIDGDVLTARIWLMLVIT
jgi:hypothetical protein